MDEQASKLGTGLSWIGLICMITLVMIRAMVEHDSFPWWETDPFVFSPPVIGLTPTKALVLNLAVVLSSCLVLVGLYLRKEHLDNLGAFLMLLGISVITYHLFTDIESVSEGSNLLAVVCVLFVASYISKIHGAQQIVAAITLGFSALLVVMGAYEMYVVHPNTVANYEQTSDAFLTARGWTQGSYEALAYERRLFQPEPIAWFGLTNVFASFAGACSAGLLMLGWGLRKSDRLSLVFLLSGLIAFAGLLMTGSKGGIGAFILGICLTVSAGLITRKKIDGRMIIGGCGLVLAGVVARGFLGERIGELSLLFRSHYMTGSLRMFFERPIIGVGPGAFQENYALLKPAMSPEDVASAHSFPFDLLATLGLGGLVLFFVFLLILARIRPNTETQSPSSSTDQKRLIQLTMMTVVIVSAISIRFGSPAMDTDLLLVQVLGSLAWAGLAYAIVRRAIAGHAFRWAMFASGSVLAIHSMIEVSASWHVSGMLWALMIGSACTTSAFRGISSPKYLEYRHMHLALVIGLIGSAFSVAMKLPTIAHWEQELNSAASSAIRISLLRQQVNALEFSNTPDQLRQQIASELSEIAGHRVSDSIDQIVGELNRAELDGREDAADHLNRAAQIRPSHVDTYIAASQQMLWRASVLDSLGQSDDSRQLWDESIDLLDLGVAGSESSVGYRWLGSAWLGRAMQFPDDPDRDFWLVQAQSSWIQAAQLAPHSPHLAVKLSDIAIELRQTEQAVLWARKALEVHENSRLDPIRGIGESDLMRLRALARTEPGAGIDEGP